MHSMMVLVAAGAGVDPGDGAVAAHSAMPMLWAATISSGALALREAAAVHTHARQRKPARVRLCGFGVRRHMQHPHAAEAVHVYPGACAP
jgi:hypothetical protein